MDAQQTARLRIGPITQLRVTDPVVTPGSTVCGEVVVATGATAARLADLTLALVTDVPSGGRPLPRVLAKEPLAPFVTVTPYQTRTLPFSFTVPPYTPLSLGSQRVILRTIPELFATGTGDSDILAVRPHPLMERVFTSLEELGFWLGGVEYVALRRPARRFPYTQVFTFRPPGRFQHDTASLRLWFALGEDTLETLLELAPTRTRGPRFGLRLARLVLAEGDQWESVTPRLQRLITRRIDHRTLTRQGGQTQEVSK